ncbi:response regulator [Candidatus Nitronereus thalassa]|uniref:Response regulator n=1 Tax=Candidatus Nitronereus thalassa TaxID=3020898 RepID=A0ABU3K8Q5_9BACT|nr:response regulator [Candidatus Nitronereus thalassa]MDT7042752.1 response regulator [Candidatus Nitronereus thalassa]
MSISSNSFQPRPLISINEEGRNCCVILVVDDDDAMRSLLVDELGDYGCCVLEAADGEEALSQIQAKTPSLIVTDLQMKSGGFDFIKNVKTVTPDCRVIVVTAFGDSQTHGIAKNIGVDGYFDKPVRMDDLKTLVMKVCPVPHCPHVQVNLE